MPVNTWANKTYKMVQMPNETKMPIGISFLGFLASCAAVDTASKPIKAKKTTPAPLMMPDIPYLPNQPSEIKSKNPF